MSRLEIRHLHQQVMKPKSKSGERQGGGGGAVSKSKLMAGPQCHAEELSLHIEGTGKLLGMFKQGEGVTGFGSWVQFHNPGRNPT